MLAAAMPVLLLPVVLGVLVVAGTACLDDEVLIVGHRGAPYLAPENSVEGFQVAAELGADGVEFDVNWSLDRKNIVIHDGTLDRTTDCSGRVRERTAAELSMCRLANGEPLRTLEEVLALIDGTLPYLFVEIKDHGAAAAQTDAVVATIRSLAPRSTCVINSNSLAVLRRLAPRLGGRVVGGWDISSGVAIAASEVRPFRWVMAPTDEMDVRFGDVAAGLGHRAVVFGVNTPVQFRQVYKAGVRAMMSDSVQAMRAMAQ